MSSTDLFRRLMTRVFRPRPTRIRRVKRACLGVETLEDRTTPATTLSTASGVLTIQVGAGEVTNLTVDAGGHLAVNDAANVADTTGLFINSGTPTATEVNPLTTDFSAIHITGTSGTETVNFNGGAFIQTTATDGLIHGISLTGATNSFTGTGLFINESGATNSAVDINSNLTTTGTAAISIATSGQIVVDGGATVSTVDGGIVFSANAGAAATGNFTGVIITSAGTKITTSGQGGISLNGTGSDAAGAGGRIGVRISSGAVVSSTSAVNGGSIAIGGVGASGAGGFDDGVQIAGVGTAVTSVSGAISINGTGGADGGQASYGVELRDGAQVRSTGAAPNAGSIFIVGQGGGSAVTGQFEIGVSLDETGGVGAPGAANKTKVTSVDGAITIVGAGGTAGITPSNNDGVVISHGTSVTSTGLGTVSINGAATVSGATGVLIAFPDLGDATATTVSTNTGTLGITGSSAAGADAIHLGDTSGTDASITAGAAVTLTGNGAGGNIVLLDPITATGQLVTLTTANGNIVQPTTTAAVTAVTANRLNAHASTGVGTLANPITTAVANLQANSATGGVFVSNTGAFSVVGTGVKTTTSGNIGLTATGTVTATTNGAVLLAANGNISVTATGATSDILTGGGQSTVQTNGAGNTIALSAGRNVVVGSGGAVGSVQTTGGGAASVSITAGTGLTAGSITVDNGSAVQASGTGTVTLDASAINGGNVSLAQASATGATVSSNSGAITVTTGLDGTFTNDSGAAGGVTSTSGPITVNANTVTDKNPITTAGAVAVNLTTSSGVTGGSVAIGTNTVNAPITGSTVTITGTANPDTFTLSQDSGGSAMTINAGNPAPFANPGDVLSLPGGGGTNTPTGAGSGQVTGATGLPTVSYSSIESFVTSTTTPTNLTADFTALDATTITLVRTGVGGATLEVLANGTLVAADDYASVGSVTVTGSINADTLIVDNSGGLINRTIAYNGGLGADALVVQGDTGAGATVTATYTTGVSVPVLGNSGSLAYTDGTNTETINFTGLAPVETLTPVTSLVINDASASTTENIVNGPTSTGVDPIVGGNQPTYQVTFANPVAESIDWRNATTVTVNGSAGNDTVLVNLPVQLDAAAGAFALTTLNVDTGNAGAGDTVNVVATPAGVATVVTGGTGANVANVGSLAPVTTGGTLAGINGTLQFLTTGAPGTFAITLDDSGDATARPTATLDTIAGNFDRLTGLGNTGAITYSQASTASVVVKAPNAATTLLVNQTGMGNFTTTVDFQNTGNTANVQATSAGGTYDLNFSGTDTANIGNAGLTSGILGADMNITGVASTHVVVDDSADSVGQTVTIGTTQLSGLTAGPITFTLPAGSNLDVMGGSGSDTFNVTPSTTVAISVNGGNPPPPAVPGDTLSIDTSGTTNATLSATPSAAGYSGNWTFGNRMAVTFAQIESLSQSTVISGTVFADTNRSGVQDPSEVGVAGVTVTLDLGADGTVDQTTTTDANGNYSFLVAANTTVRVRIVVPAGEKQTTANPNDFVTQNGVNVALNFGIAVPLPPQTNILVSAGAGQTSLVNLADGSAAPLTPFPGFLGEVSVARGDVNGDGVLDYIFGVGSGTSSHIEVFDGATGSLLASFFAFDPVFQGGVSVAAGDINGDGMADIIVGAGAGEPGGHVIVIDGTKLTQVQSNGQIADSALLASFFAFNPVFQGGVSVAAGDINGDGKADIIVGAGAGEPGGHVIVIDGTKLTQVQSNGQIADAAVLRSFFAFDQSFTGGVFVSSADLAGDGKVEIVVGAGAGATPNVEVFGASDQPILTYLAFGEPFRGGVRVASMDLNGDGKDEIVAGSGPGARGHAEVIDSNGNLIYSLFVTDPSSTAGIFVA